MIRERAIERMKQAFAEMPTGIDHTLKVLQNAEQIMDQEITDPEMRERITLTVILHDVGAVEAWRKYQSISGHHQEKEGPEAAGKILRELGYDPEETERVCYIIGNHHTPEKIDGLDFQIQWEADLLENLTAMEIKNDPERLTGFIEKHFKTAAGKALAMDRFVRGADI